MAKIHIEQDLSAHSFSPSYEGQIWKAALSASPSQHPLSTFRSLSPLPHTPSPRPPGGKDTTSGLNPQAVVWAPWGLISSTRSCPPCSKHVRLIQSRYKVVERSRGPEVQAAGASGQGPETSPLIIACGLQRPWGHTPVESRTPVGCVASPLCPPSFLWTLSWQLSVGGHVDLQTTDPPSVLELATEI